MKTKVKKETRQTHQERINWSTSSLVYVLLLNQVTGHFQLLNLGLMGKAFWWGRIREEIPSWVFNF